MGISIGIICGIIAMFSFGIANSLLKVPASKMSPIKNLFVRNIFMSGFLLIVLLFFLKSAVFDIKYVIIALIISFIGGYLPMITFFKSLQHGKVGVIAPIAQSATLFTILFAVIFYKETFNFWQVCSIIIILCGIILMSINLKDLKKSDLFSLKSGILFALITCFLWGLGFFLFKIPINVIGPILTSFLIEFGILIFATIHLTFTYLSTKKINNKQISNKKVSTKTIKNNKESPFKLPEKKILWLYFIYAIFGVTASLALNFGFKYANNVSIVSAIVAANPLISTIYGKIVYKEKLKVQQYFAFAIILIGIISLTLLASN